MPRELLRDVLRTGDAANRRQRHWSILPLSVAGHAIVAAGVVIAPLAAEVEPPTISPPSRVESFMPTVAPPSPPPPRTPPRVIAPTGAAPRDAPSTIEPEPERTSYTPGPDLGPGVARNPPSLTGIGVAGPLPVPPAPPPVQPKLVRVGYGIREPKKIVHVTPDYPEMARRVRVGGTVILEAILDVTGKVERVRVLRSVALLDDAAIRAVQQWRYTPTELNGVPVPVLMTITVQFSLQ